MKNPSDIFKKENRWRNVSAFSFFKISECFVNHSLAKQRPRNEFFYGVFADQKLSTVPVEVNKRVFMRSFSSLIHAPAHELRLSLVKQYGFAFKIAFAILAKPVTPRDQFAL